MKIICDSCGAKYSIADDKVAGKVFKIRCKKCSNMIVVRGDEGASAAAAPAAQPVPVFQAAPAAAEPMRAATPSVQPTAMAAPALQQALSQSDPSEEPLWHVVVGGDQQGPFAPAQIGEMLTVGTIDWEAYVWREGFDGWVPARDVPELVEAITGQPYDSSYSSSAGAAPAPGPANPFSDAPADQEGTAVAASPFAGGDFASSFATAEEPPAATRESGELGHATGLLGGASRAAEPARPAARSGDLFAQAAPAAASPFSGGPAPTSAPDQTSMTGQRNENSVLFSLANLQSLASESAPKTAPSTRPGHAAGEGSGLIDIRALASASSMRAQAPVTSGMPVAPKDDRIDDLMSIGTGSPLAMGTLGAPVLAPVRDDSNKKLIMMIGGGAVALVLLLIGVIVILLKKDGDGAVAAAPPITAPADPPTGAGSAAPSAAVPSATGSSGEVKPADPAPAERPTELAQNDATERSGGGEGTRAVRRPPARSGGSASSSSPPASEPTRAPSKSSGSDSMTDLLDKAIGGSGSPSGKKESAKAESDGDDSNLPDQPDRDAVAAALRSVAASVKACGAGKSGMAMTKIVVSGDTGRVKNAEVTGGPFVGTPEGSCVARAVRAARFPRFRRSEMTVNFPYSL